MEPNFVIPLKKKKQFIRFEKGVSYVDEKFHSVKIVKSYCALKMEMPEGHFCHILLFYFRKGKNAAQAHRKLCGVYDDKYLKNASVRIGLFVFVPEILMLNVKDIFRLATSLRN